jgi:hypothetical protein
MSAAALSNNGGGMAEVESSYIDDYSSRVLDAIGSAQQETGIKLSSFVVQIVHAWIMALAFEGPDPLEPLTQADPEGANVAAEVMSQVPNLIVNIASDLNITDRKPVRQTVITSADMFHWLTEYGRDRLAFIRWPYPKD